MCKAFDYITGMTDLTDTEYKSIFGFENPANAPITPPPIDEPELSREAIDAELSKLS